ncbi:MAG TPA: peptidylprolyl isomerase [Desulfobacterales bacterium]|nr:peptidylprolyl isomerase [Desulfobacterales bacterium]
MRLCSQGANRLIIAAMAICLLAGPAWADKAASSGKEAASVNGKPISKSQYERDLSIFQKQAAQKGQQLSDADLTSIKNRILDNLIDAEVLYQQSQKEGVKVDDQVINEQIETIKKRFPDEAAYKKALEGMDFSEKEIRAEIQRSLAINQLLDTNVRQKITVTEEESKKYYDNNPNLFKQPEQAKASHILIKVAPDAEESKKIQARKKIETVQKKVRQGEDFGLLAKANSEGPTAQREGDLGYFSRSQMVKPFEDAAFALNVGEVSGIVETQFGYHLIKLTDKKAARTIPYKEVQLRLEQNLKREKEKTEIQGYIENLKKSAKIKRFI